MTCPHEHQRLLEHSRTGTMEATSGSHLLMSLKVFAQTQAAALLSLTLACGGPRATDTQEFEGRYAPEGELVVWCDRGDDQSPALLIGSVTLEFPLEHDAQGNLPLPPLHNATCSTSVVAHVLEDELRLSGEACTRNVPADQMFDAYVLRFSEIGGKGYWDDGGLEIEVEYVRQATPGPDSLPPWWGDPLACHERYRLVRIE